MLSGAEAQAKRALRPPEDVVCQIKSELEQMMGIGSYCRQPSVPLIEGIAHRRLLPPCFSRLVAAASGI
jgi:hypothetical protein